MKTITILLFMGTLLAGCRFVEHADLKVSEQRFVGYVSGDGFFRLNTVDGTVYSYNQGKLVLVPSGHVKLLVGQLYTDENGKAMIYEGNGTFSYSDKKITDSLLEKYK